MSVPSQLHCMHLRTNHRLYGTVVLLLTRRCPRGGCKKDPPMFFVYNFFHLILNCVLLGICRAIIFTHVGVYIKRISQSHANFLRFYPRYPRSIKLTSDRLLELAHVSLFPDFISSIFQWQPHNSEISQLAGHIVLTANVDGSNWK